MARNDNLPVRQGDAWMSPTRRTDPWRPDTLFSASPWQMIRQMREEMERMFGDLVSSAGSMAPWHAASSEHGVQAWNPSVDVCEDSNEYCIDVDLPGIRKDDIQVEVQNGQITIRAEMHQEPGGRTAQPDRQNQLTSGGQSDNQSPRKYHMRERRYGYFSRTFPIPDDAVEDQIRCDFRDGVLTCHLPKSAQKQSQARRIPIGEESMPSLSADAAPNTTQPTAADGQQARSRKKAA